MDLKVPSISIVQRVYKIVLVCWWSWFVHVSVSANFALKCVGDSCAMFLNLYDFDILHNHITAYLIRHNYTTSSSRARFSSEKLVLLVLIGFHAREWLEVILILAYFFYLCIALLWFSSTFIQSFTQLSQSFFGIQSLDDFYWKTFKMYMLDFLKCPSF